MNQTLSKSATETEQATEQATTQAGAQALTVRPARLGDAANIYALIADYASKGTLLPRSLAEVCENVRDFVVVEKNAEHGAEGTEFLGCGALHLYGPHLAEVRSIAVWPASKGLGAGRLLMDGLLAEAERHEVHCICLFTRIPQFFARMGFEVARKEDLPDKLLKDCLRCPKLDCCDETTMIRGPLPQYSILDDEPDAQKLVRITS
jgi:amino-acid N-acetyltransferase